MENDFTQFIGHSYLNLETFRRNGTGVQTPVWFVQDGTVLYVQTMDGSGKVKRVKLNTKVRVAPCDMRGGLRGEWQPATAELVDGAEAARVESLLSKKYGLMKFLFGLTARKQNNVVIRIMAG